MSSGVPGPEPNTRYQTGPPGTSVKPSPGVSVADCTLAAAHRASSAKTAIRTPDRFIIQVPGFAAAPRSPYAAERHGDCLAVYAPGSVAAQECDDLGDLARLQHAVLRVDRGAFAPDLL